MGLFTSADEKLCDKFARGEVADFDGEEVSPKAIRAIILGIDIKNKFAELRAISQSALRIRGARINGRLELDNISAPGGGMLPTLMFERCTLVGGISVANSHFVHLSLIDCTFVSQDDSEPTINLIAAGIGSDVVVRHARAADSDGVLWFDARNAHVDGDLILNSSRFRTPAAREKRRHAENNIYAVCAAGAEISGSILALGGLEADGGVNISNAHIQGDVWFSGALLEKREGHAFTAQLTRIDGSLSLNALPDERESTEYRVFRAEGNVHLFGVRIGMDLWLDGARIRNPGGTALDLTRATIGGDLSITGYDNRPGAEARALGELALHGVSVGSSAWIGPLYNGITGSDIALICDSISVAKQFSLLGVTPLPRDSAREDRKKQFFALDPLPATAVRQAFNPTLQRELCKNGISMIAAQLGSLVIGQAVERDGGVVKLKPTTLNGGFLAPAMTCATECHISGDVFGDVNLMSLTLRNGSLNVAGMRLISSESGPKAAAPEMLLKDADIGKSLQIRMEDKQGQQSGAAQAQSGVELAEVREAPLKCMPGYSIVEVLWAGEVPRMTAHLVRRQPSRNPLLRLLGLGQRESVLTFAGTSQLFFELREAGALVLDDVEQAAEFLRLFCGQVQGEDGAFRIYEPGEVLPHGISVDCEPIAEGLAARERSVAELKAKLDPDNALDGAQLAEAEQILAMMRALASGDVARGIALQIEPLKIQKQGETFQATADLLYGNAFFRANFEIDAAHKTNIVAMKNDDPLSPDLVVPLRYDGKVVSSESKSQGWPMGPVVPGMEALSGRALRRAQDLLASHSPDIAEFSNAIIDLEDAQCDTLRDGGGSDWGASVTLKLDRFTYRHAQSLPGEVGDAVVSRARKALRRIFGYERRSGSARYASLLQQYSRGDQARPAWQSVLAEYRPQPFEQLIRVARASGDEEMATTVEIKKNWIEGWRFARRFRGWLTLLGLVGAAAWGGTHGVNNLVDVGVLALIAVPTALLFDIGNIALWGMFGYLRRPVNAVVTLCLFFALGAWGVHVANANDRMVIEVTPTAGSIDARQARFATPVDRGQAAGDLKCGGEINETLYAIDVFIPLIDLRQETRCTVGIVAGSETAPAGAASGGSWLDQQASDLRRRTIESRPFWEIAKALYGLLGWAILSLSILTFARISRQYSEG